MQENTFADLPPWESLVPIDLYMDQVVALVNKYLRTNEVTPMMINNYVKLKVMPAPIKKKYSRVSLAYIIMICTLKASIPMTAIQYIIPIDLDEQAVKDLYGRFLGMYESTAADIAGKAPGAAPEEPDGDDETRMRIMHCALTSGIYKSLAGQLLEKSSFYEKPKRQHTSRNV